MSVGYSRGCRWWHPHVSVLPKGPKYKQMTLLSLEDDNHSDNTPPPPQHYISKMLETTEGHIIYCSVW
jgi:hypothetical protein